MSRWCLSPIIGNGTSVKVAGQEATTGPYRAAVADVIQTHAAFIPGNDDGTPMFNWCVCKIDDASVTAANAVTGVTVFPALQMTDVLTLAQRNWLITKVSALGKPTGWITPGITAGQAIRTIGRYLHNQFDVDWLDIAA